ncbi:helix-turn-helix transcriptional regulator [Streptomyces roseirectus]|uniref:Helix-turn-helix transcriptional regulator n=1 Tax=Streptomyces roseirectus TaxID=2768066 RepID=A0A7H0IR15_9ACTN|nr:helix-turn-helix transcriptional regulator [Streptomyces roseirectus]QNP75231.1 helix-turn-helix transcriptional regulator [Streptomyces roseirectus]
MDKRSVTGLRATTRECGTDTYVPGMFLSGDGDAALPPDELCLALDNLDFANRGVERVMVTEQAERLLDSAEPHVNPHRTWLAILSLLYAGDLASADAQCERLARDPAWAGSVRCQELLMLLRARSSLLAGRARRARNVLKAVLNRRPSASPACLAVAWLVEALVHLGELKCAHQVLLERELAGPLAPDLPDRAQILAARGALHMAGGHFQHAVDDYLACGSVLDTSSVANPAVIPWRSKAVFGALGARRYDLALALAEEELIAARRWGAPRGIGLALHAVGVARRDDTSVALLEEAVELLALARARTELMQALHDLGMMQARRQDVTAARRRLDEAAVVASECGNTFWQERIGLALERLGAPDNASTLTRQEEKIAYLARAGYSNRCIAEMNFLTVRTVEFHLSSVYRKLSISGRRELVAVLSPAAS